MNRNAARFQLVLQFSAMSPHEFDAVVALEEELIRGLPQIAEVDGHDFGAGEFNIFVLTDRPTEAFDVAKILIQRQRPQQQLRAAYRDIAKRRVCDSLAARTEGIHGWVRCFCIPHLFEMRCARLDS
jgi:hypothetical protein